MANYKRQRRQQLRRPRKKARIMRPLAGPSRTMRGTLVNAVRTFNYSYWQPSTATTADFWKFFAFRFSDLPSVAEFRALFDLVKLNRIKVVFRPRFNSFEGANTTDTVPPGVTNQSGTNLHIIADPYNITSPAGLYTRANMNTFLENGKVRSYNGNRAIKVYWKPTTFITLDGSAVGKLIPAPWCQCAADPQYYGFHAFAQDVNMNGTFGNSWDVFVTYYMQFKGLK